MQRLEREAALIDSMLTYARMLPGELTGPETVTYGEERTFFATAYRHNDRSKSMKMAASVSDYVRLCRQLLGGVRYPIGRMVSHRALEAGMDAHAAKPIDIERLVRLLRRLIKRR